MMSVMKEVFHQRECIDCKAFISNPVNVPAINYGKKNEHPAIIGYEDHQKSSGKIIQVEPCGTVLWVAHHCYYYLSCDHAQHTPVCKTAVVSKAAASY